LAERARVIAQSAVCKRRPPAGAGVLSRRHGRDRGRTAPPTLVIAGENDHMVPRFHGETYARLIPGAGELKLIPKAGHSVQVEEADATARLVMDFLAP